MGDIKAAKPKVLNALMEIYSESEKEDIIPEYTEKDLLLMGMEMKDIGQLVDEGLLKTTGIKIIGRFGGVAVEATHYMITPSGYSTMKEFSESRDIPVMSEYR